MNPIARLKMIEVILFLKRCAVKFLRTSSFIEVCSQTKRVCVRMTSKRRCKLKDKRVRPKSIPRRIRKKILRISEKFRESMESGRK